MSLEGDSEPSLPSPQGVLQLELIRGFIHQAFLNNGFLLQRQLSTRIHLAVSAPGAQSFHTTYLIFLDPATYGQVTDTNLFSNILVCMPLGLPHADGLVTLFFLSRSRKEWASSFMRQLYDIYLMVGLMACSWWSLHANLKTIDTQ